MFGANLRIYLPIYIYIHYFILCIYDYARTIIAKCRDDGRGFFGQLKFLFISSSSPSSMVQSTTRVECILVFGYSYICACLVLYITVDLYLLRRCWRCYRCLGMGDGRGGRGVWWWQRRSWKRDDNIIIANVIFATRRTPFVRKLANKYIFFTATRHPRGRVKTTAKRERKSLPVVKELKKDLK